MCMNGPLVFMAFGPLFGLWPSSLFMLLCDHGPRHFMLQNWSKTCKNELPPKYMSKCENSQVRVPSGGLVHESSRRIYQNLS